MPDNGRSKVQIAPEQYLEGEREATHKHEFWYGGVFAMAGGTLAHSLVIANVQGELRNLLRDKPCLVLNSDLRVAVSWNELIKYPDATVVCGTPQYTDREADTLTNPTCVIEVLSPSTARTDRGDKAFLYRRVASMREILLVEPRQTWIEHQTKLPDGRREIETITDPAAVIRLPNLDVELPVAEIYRGADRL